MPSNGEARAQRVWWKVRGNGMETEGVRRLRGFSVKFVSIKNNESLYIYIIELHIFFLNSVDS